MAFIPIHVEYPISEENDDKLIQIQYLIEAKRDFLINKQKELKKTVKQNEFLNSVKEDYDKYNSYIIQQKNDQIRSLQLLNQYIDDLNVSGSLSKNNLKDSKHEQKKILKEIGSIRKGLDEIINNTNIVTNTLESKNIII
jgi:hypothetical protein